MTELNWRWKYPVEKWEKTKNREVQWNIIFSSEYWLYDEFFKLCVLYFGFMCVCVCVCVCVGHATWLVETEFPGQESNLGPWQLKC